MKSDEFWKGEGGDAYTARNRVNWVKRIPFWTDIIARTGAGFVIEVGCNFGANLLALRAVRGAIELAGVDVNLTALAAARNLGFRTLDFIPATAAFDLAFTCGCLIHIPPCDLPNKMREIVEASCEYVLAIEYFAEDECEITYRGESGLLWKRDYGSLYEGLGLEIVGYGVLPPDEGFDNCHWWLMRKPDAKDT